MNGQLCLRLKRLDGFFAPLFPEEALTAAKLGLLATRTLYAFLVLDEFVPDSFHVGTDAQVVVFLLVSGAFSHPCMVAAQLQAVAPRPLLLSD